MKIERLQKKLSQEIIFQRISDRYAGIELVILYSPDFSGCDASELLLISEDDYTDDIGTRAHNCLILGTRENLDKIKKPERQPPKNLLMLSSGKSLFAIANEISKVLQTDRTFPKKLSGLLARRDIQQITRVLEEELMCAVCFLNRYGEIIAQSDKVLPASTITSAIEKLSGQAQTRLPEAAIYGLTLSCGRCTDGFLLIGYDSAPFTEEDERLIERYREPFSKAISPYNRRGWDEFSEELKKLLSGGAYVFSVIMENIKMLGWKADDYYYIFKISRKDGLTALTLTEEEGLRKTVAQMYEASWLVSVEGAIYWILNRSQHQKVFSSAIHERLKEEKRRRDIVIGVSYTFFEFTPQTLLIAKLQADLAILNGQKFSYDENYDYKRILIYDILYNCDRTVDVARFIHPSIRKLALYDAEKGANYIETLRIYLLCNMKIKESTARLGIHKNTLFYRLNKIQEIVTLRFDDFMQTFQYNLSICIMDYMEKQGNSPFKAKFRKKNNCKLQ